MGVARPASASRVEKRAMIGVGVVGLGVGEQHLEAYRRDPRCAVRWVHDLDADRMRSAAPEGGPTRTAARFEQVLKDDAVDLISIASYDDDHFGQVMAALDAGKHVFVEKPLCRSRKELTDVRAAWLKAGAHQLASNLVLRASPLYVWLRDAIRRGDFGEIYAFDGEYLFGRLDKITDGWRRNVDDYSVIQGGGVHLVDLMLRLTGQRPERVWASGNRICTRGTAFRYADYVAATYGFRSGMIGRISANFGCVHRHQHVVRVFGTRATFLYDDAGPRLVASRDPETPAQPLDYAALPAHKGALIPEFVERVLSGSADTAATEHEFDVIRACVAADEALSQGREMEIHYA